MEDLYQEIILDHNKRPRNFGPLPGATHRADGRNPLCGDELMVSLCISGDKVEAVHFQGQGCAISKASASLMTEAVTGQRIEKARSIAHGIIDGLATRASELKFEEIGDLAALSGVHKFPARIKCATLAWHALLSALDGRSSVSTETVQTPYPKP
jgi:nitrogen fixation NifU-like protein